jgi:hypothetical protein
MENVPPHITTLSITTPNGIQTRVLLFERLQIVDVLNSTTTFTIGSKLKINFCRRIIPALLFKIITHTLLHTPDVDSFVE